MENFSKLKNSTFSYKGITLQEKMGIYTFGMRRIAYEGGDAGIVGEGLEFTLKSIILIVEWKEEVGNE